MHQRGVAARNGGHDAVQWLAAAPGEIAVRLADMVPGRLVASMAAVRTGIARVPAALGAADGAVNAVLSKRLRAECTLLGHALATPEVAVKIAGVVAFPAKALVALVVACVPDNAAAVGCMLD